jgi:hypothetical protein
VTPQEVYDLLHGHASAFADARVDRFRAEAGLRLRQMRGEKAPLLRWIAENRARIEENVAWAEMRAGLFTVADARAALRQMIMDALGAEEVASGSSTYTRVYAPGYNVSVGIDYETYDPTRVRVSIDIRTDKDKPVYFPWEPTPEQIKRAKDYYDAERRYWHRASAQDARLGREKQPLSGIYFALPVEKVREGGEYHAPTTMTDAQFQDERRRKAYRIDKWENETDAEYRNRLLGHRLARGMEKTPRGYDSAASRIFVPVLLTGEATFDLTFRHSPSKNSSYEDIKRTVEGVTFETLAQTIYDMVGVGFPRSPYFRG